MHPNGQLPSRSGFGDVDPPCTPVPPGAFNKIEKKRAAKATAVFRGAICQKLPVTFTWLLRQPPGCPRARTFAKALPGPGITSAVFDRSAPLPPGGPS